MNKNPQVDDTSRGAFSSVATGFAVGALIGAGVALLLAPGSGKETRRRISDAGTRLSNTARNRIDDVLDSANDLKRDAKSALKAGREAFEHDGRPSHEPRPILRPELKS